MDSPQEKKKMARGDYSITVWLEPDARELVLKRPKLVSQLLSMLNLQEESAIVARDGKLLTPDRHIWPGDHIYVRVVASRG